MQLSALQRLLSASQRSCLWGYTGRATLATQVRPSSPSVTPTKDPFPQGAPALGRAWHVRTRGGHRGFVRLCQAGGQLYSEQQRAHEGEDWIHIRGMRFHGRHGVLPEVSFWTVRHTSAEAYAPVLRASSMCVGCTR